VSLLTKKPPVSGYAMLGAQAKSAAMQAMPAAVNATTTVANQAMPLARNAGTSVRQGADGAVARATPYADAARHWAAPKLEQSAVAISENLAPMISDALIAAAHKIDTNPPRQRRFSKSSVLAGSMLLLAAGAAAALTMRNRGNGDMGFTAATSGADTGESVRIVGADRGDEDMADPDANGHPYIG
jgi:hypothetical protein